MRAEETSFAELEAACSALGAQAWAFDEEGSLVWQGGQESGWAVEQAEAALLASRSGRTTHCEGAEIRVANWKALHLVTAQRSPMLSAQTAAAHAGRVGLWQWRLDTGEFCASPLFWEKETGAPQLPQSWSEFSAHIDRECLRDLRGQVEECLAGTLSRVSAELHFPASGKWLWMRGKLAPAEEGQPHGMFHGSFVPINCHKRLEAAYQESRSILEAVTGQSVTLIYLYDVQTGNNLFCNDASRRILGLTPGEVAELGSGLLAKVVHPEDWPLVQDGFEQLMNLKQGMIRRLEYRIIQPGGRMRWLRSHESVFKTDDKGRPRIMLGNAIDITSDMMNRERLEAFIMGAREENDRMAATKNDLAEELARVEAERSALIRESTTDPLTGLPNRRAFVQEMERLSLAVGDGRFGLVMLDLDRFKALNDTFGHPAGDEALRQVGQVLRGFAEARWSACRIGGEEFAVTFATGDPAHLMVKAEGLRKALEEAAWSHRSVTASLGAAIAAPNESMTDLIARADRALYEAKSNGRNCSVLAPPAEGQRQAA
jgi:diguanylate cyclase (GGDEF)-like protein/PAS domain S-box-containing protein